jgi:hypothetical protein
VTTVVVYYGLPHTKFCPKVEKFDFSFSKSSGYTLKSNIELNDTFALYSRLDAIDFNRLNYLISAKNFISLRK